MKRVAGHDPLPVATERFASEIVDAAFKVHDALGPGLMESVYEACMRHELTKRQVPFSANWQFRACTMDCVWMLDCV